MVDGESRTLLFDQASFTLTDSVRVAEVARMITSAFINCPDAVEYVDSIVEDTTVAHLEEAAFRLAEMNWQTLANPTDLFTVYGEWTPDLQRLSETREHPLHEAFAVATGAASSTAMQEPFEPPEIVDHVAAEAAAVESSPIDPVPVSTAEQPVAEASDADAASPIHRTLSAEEVAQLLGEPTEALDISDVLSIEDEGPPLPDLSAPAEQAEEERFVGDPPPLPDPSVPLDTVQDPSDRPTISNTPPPLPDPSAPVEEETDEGVIGFDDEDDPLLTTPPPSFKT